MLSAHGDVRLVAADLYLCPGSHGSTIAPESHDHSCFAAAMADGLDLTQLIGKGQEFAAAFEELSLEICADAVYQDGNVHPVDDVAQLINLGGGKELPLVN